MRESGKRNPKQSVPAGACARGDKERLNLVIICVLLVGIVGIVFGQTVRHDFINYDDGAYVKGNVHVLSGLNWPDVKWAFTTGHTGYAHPVTWLTHQLDCQLYGTWAGGHHLTSVVIHSANSILLFLLLWRMTSALWPSAFVAALFAIHPLHVESVAWVAERKDVLSGLFFFLTLHAYVAYAAKPQLGRYLLTLGLFVLGILSKPMLVTVPCLLLLLDYWPLRRMTLSASEHDPASRFSLGRLVLEKVPFAVIAAGWSLLTFVIGKEYGVVAEETHFGITRRVANALVSYIIYVWNTFWPRDLALFYPYPETLPSGAVLFSGICLVLISIFCLVKIRSSPYLAVGWFWYLGMLVPVIGFIQVGGQARADRYTYLPQIGLFLLVTWSATKLLARLRRGQEALAVMGLLVIIGLMACSYVQASYWQNSETVWNHALGVTVGNHIAYNNLGNVMIDKSQLDDAIYNFRKATEISPDYCEAQSNLGKALMLKGRSDEAVLHFRKALDICKDRSDVYNDLGHALARQGNWVEAITAYRAAIRTGPQHPNAHDNNNLGIALAKVGQTDEAIEQFQEALRIEGDYREAHCNLALVLVQVGRRDEAIAHLREALRLKPDDAQARAQLRQLGVE